MKVLLVNKFHYNKGGAETYYFAVEEALKKAGHEVIFFSMKHPNNLPCPQEKYFVSNADYNSGSGVLASLKMGIKLLYSFEAKKKFQMLLEDEKPDIIHLNNVHRQITLSILDAAKKMNIPVVFTLHDLTCVCPSNVMLSPYGPCDKCLNGSFMPCIQMNCVKNSKLKSILAVMEARLYRLLKQYDKVDAYIAPSLFLKGKMQKGNLTRKPIEHVVNFLPSSVEFVRSKNSENYYLFFGRVSVEKGIITLVKAFSHLPGNAVLKIAGDGPQLEEIKEFINEKGLTNRIELLGFLNRKEMEEAISLSKCVVVPSECYENGPYSVMETLAKGIPVITSRMGGLPEMVKDGVNGFTFEAGNAEDLADKLIMFENLTTDEQDELKDNALRDAKENFSSERYTKEILHIYNKVLKRNI